MIAFAVALGLSWTGIAIPADVKEETKEKARDTKDGMDQSGRSAKVRTAQQALADKGYNPGPVDGLMGPKTRAAVED